MNKQSEYICPICGKDSLCTDFTDGMKWGRAYCVSCDCGGPEVRTGYEENLDAPWRTEARKQFVEVVNENVGKRVKGCWYCNDDVMQVVDSPNKPPINATYCGMCGRKLEGRQ